MRGNFRTQKCENKCPSRAGVVKMRKTSTSSSSGETFSNGQTTFPAGRYTLRFNKKSVKGATNQNSAFRNLQRSDWWCLLVPNLSLKSFIFHLTFATLVSLCGDRTRNIILLPERVGDGVWLSGSHPPRQNRNYGTRIRPAALRLAPFRRNFLVLSVTPTHLLIWYIYM